MTALTLYQIEEDLQALLDTQDMVPAEQLAEFERELFGALTRSVDKRQRCAEFLLFCSSMQDNCDGEIDRLARLKQTYEKAAERMEGYIVRVIEGLGPDDRGKYARLVGRTATLGVARNPDSVDVQDESLIPSEYKNVTVKLPAEVWSELLQAFRDDDGGRVSDISKILQAAGEKAAISIDRAAIKQVIKDGGVVDGADISMGALRCKVS